MLKAGLFALITLGFCLLAACCPRVGRCATVGMHQCDDKAEPFIKRDKETKDITVTVTQPGAWRLYSGNSLQEVDFSSPVAQGDGCGSFAVSGNDKRWLFFVLEQSGQRISLAERHLPMSGGYNFRDLGGIRTSDGRYLQWGKLLRSDSLVRLTQDDLEYLASIPVTTIVDFRTEEEAEKSPDLLPSSVKQRLHLAISPGNLDPQERDALLISGAGEQFMRHVNQLLVEDEDIIRTYQDFFLQIQNEERLPLLFHCSAGKDRTGYAAALVLFSLGVDKQTVMNDYMDSARYLAGKYDAIIDGKPERAPLFTVQPDYLQTAIDAMERKSGSIERYLTDVLGVDLQKMREMFLQ